MNVQVIRLILLWQLMLIQFTASLRFVFTVHFRTQNPLSSHHHHQSSTFLPMFLNLVPLDVVIQRTCIPKTMINCTLFLYIYSGLYFFFLTYRCRTQWPRGLMRRSAAAHLLRLWVRIPAGAWTFVWCKCCVLVGRGLWDDLINRPE
jgi:hypothetical protein